MQAPFFLYENTGPLHYISIMSQGLLHKLIDILVKVCSSLGAVIPCCDLERIGVIIHRIMSYQSRQFHTLEHVFGFMEQSDALASLAAIFHDLVYIQVDEGLPPDTETIIGPFVEWNGTDFLFRPCAAEDRDYRFCCALFGKDPQDAGPMKQGLNEFLSAFLMYKLIGNLVPADKLCAAAVCIEASIPFRAPDAEGRSSMERLELRLQAMSADYPESVHKDDIPELLHRAVQFSNLDVRDFKLEDPGAFLSNTWKLLPETNYALRHRGIYSIGEYRKALYSMMLFFRSLNPEYVFHSYQNVPDKQTMQVYTEKVRKNLKHSIHYLKAKLLAVGIIHAFAELSGGDAPIALFLGDISQDGSGGDELVDFLSHPDFPDWLDPQHPLIRLLRDGRLEESSFDIKNSPLALYLYLSLLPEQWSRLEKTAESYCNKEISAAELLAALPETMRLEFLHALIRMVPTRKEKLSELIS